MRRYQNYSLKAVNTLALPAVARQFVLFTHKDQLPELQQLATNHIPHNFSSAETTSAVGAIPFVQMDPVHDLSPPSIQRVFLGGGSNMVMAPVIDALIIKVQTQGIHLISQTPDELIIEAQAGENWHQFVQYCLDQGWYGLENLALIPGTVGAAPVQNIGAYGVELDHYVHQVEVWDFQLGQLQVFTAKQCEFLYRDSYFKRSPRGRYLIVSVQFALKTAAQWQPVLRYPELAADLSDLPTAITPQDVFDAVVKIRQRKLPDPAVLANAGSFFKNPIVTTQHYQELKQQYPNLVAYQHGVAHYKLAAGWLIDYAGWKGKQIGPVGMHVNQALVLVNYGGATTSDVMQLVDVVKADVKRLFAVELEQEPVSIQ